MFVLRWQFEVHRRISCKDYDNDKEGNETESLMKTASATVTKK